jgi:tetratricopeptide (TPR) repeat protein
VHIIELRRMAWLALLVGGCSTAALGIAHADADGKIPITTSSEEARQLYLKGRNLADTLRATDARRFYQEAVAKDPSFARAYLDLANTAGTAKEFFAAVKRAVALADKASEPERLMILGLDAGTKGDVAGQKARYSKLVEGFPKDERALVLLGNFYFGQQDYPAAIAEYDKAKAVAPSFSQLYNQLGYSYRFLGKYAEAEQAFKKYIELIPSDPNPYDSNAELLMKMGRFDDSIASYEKALTFDRNFVASYVGIGNDHVFLGHGDAARASYARLTNAARNNGERRTALFWSALSHVHEGATPLALAEVDKMSALARADNDLAALSADANLAGNILLEAGEADKAALKFAEGMTSIEKADVPPEVKEAARRNDLYDRARTALVKGDLKDANAKADEHARQVAAAKSIPFEVRRQHELAGRIALAEKEYGAALAELAQASQQDPRVLYLTAVALQGKGDTAKAREVCQRTADFNELNPNYAYVRAKAKAMLPKL